MTQLTPREIADGLKQFREDAISLDNKLVDLINKYPNQWAGLFKGELHVASTLEGLMEHFGDAGRGRIVVKFLDPNPRTFILAAVRHDTLEDQFEQQRLRSGSLRSLSVLEKSFIKRGSGRYVALIPSSGW